MLGVITRTARQIEREPTHKATLFLIIFAQLVCQKVLLTRFVIYYFKKEKCTPRCTLPQKNRLRRPQIETRYIFATCAAQFVEPHLPFVLFLIMSYFNDK